MENPGVIYAYKQALPVPIRYTPANPAPKRARGGFLYTMSLNLEAGSFPYCRTDVHLTGRRCSRITRICGHRHPRLGYEPDRR